jgi:nucleotide-binding universal stress UspA family protein
MTDHREFQARARRYRIVVGVDLSEYSDVVLEYALDQAARHDAPELHLVTVREKRKPTAEDVKQALWERVYPALETFNQHGADWLARLHVRRGRPDEEIVALSAEVGADLVVVGQFGLHHKRSSKKTISKLVLENATCPTLVVGAPMLLDAKQCPVCAAVREESEGDNWFCDEHHAGSKRVQVTPMTVWTGGQFQQPRILNRVA